MMAMVMKEMAENNSTMVSWLQMVDKGIDVVYAGTTRRRNFIFITITSVHSHTQERIQSNSGSCMGLFMIVENRMRCDLPRTDE
jgi:hypothetical protein